MAEPTAGRLPALAPVLAGQVRYQLLLLLRSPRALWAGVLLPVMLLVLTNLQQHQVAAASLAGRLASVRLFRWEPQPPRARRPARP
jgi:hypothetical protein